MAKRIRVSDDNGSNWYTLPGSSGDKRSEVATVNDTIYGQSWESNETSLGQWQVNSNAYMKGVAGYTANIKKGGSPTAMTNEACALVSGKTYQITNTAKRVISYSSAITVFDGATDRTSQVISIDYLDGTVTFALTYTVTGAVTITGSYIPMTTIAKGKNFTLSQSAAEIDDTDYETARGNSGNRTFDPGLRTVNLEFGGVYDTTNAFLTALQARSMLYIEGALNNDVHTMFRGFFKYHNISQQGDVGALEEETVNFGLYVPDGSLVAHPFKWYFTASSTLNTAVQKVLNAFHNETNIDIQYLPDSTNGWKGDAIVTEATLNNQIDGINEWNFTFRGSGVQTAVP